MRQKIKKGFWLLFLVMATTSFAVIVDSSKSLAAINRQINFQGKLTNPDGTNVSDNNYSILFTIYNGGTEAGGGSSVWTETQTVPVADGIFRVALGSVTSLPGSVDFNGDTLYLSVKVGADPEMLPRIRLTAAPYAFNSDSLDGLDSTGFVQLAQGIQTDSSTTNASIAINKTGITADILLLQRGGVAQVTVNNSGAMTLAQLLTGQAGASFTGGPLTLTGNAASSLTTSSGALTVTSAAAATWSTTAGNLTIQAGSGTVSLGTSTILTASGAISIQPGSGDVQVGPTVGDTTGTLLVLDTKTDTGDPSGVNGGMYYSADSAKFRCYENGSWKNCADGGTPTIAQFYDQTGGIDLNTTTPVAVPFDMETRKDNGITHDTVTNNTRVYLDAAGWYKISYQVSGANQSTTRNNVFCQLRFNGSTNNIPSGSYSYVRDTTNAYGTNSSVVLTQTSSANQYYEVMCSQFGTAGVQLAVANQSWTIVEKVNVNSGTTLQAVYDNGNTIQTTDGRDILFTLNDTATDANILINLKCTGSCGGNGRFAIQSDGTDIATFNGNGSILFKNSTDSTNAFSIQYASSTSTLMQVDTQNSLVYIGNVVSDSNGVLLVLDTKDTDGDPTGVNGGMYYNSNNGRSRCYENGYWSDCATTRVLGETTLGAAAATISITLSASTEYLECHLDVKGRSAASMPYLRFNSNSDAASYGWNITGIVAAATTDWQDASDSEIQLSGTQTGTNPFSATINITNFSDTAKVVNWTAAGLETVGTNSNIYSGVGGFYNTTAQISSVQFVASGGNFTTGSHAWCEGRNVR